MLVYLLLSCYNQDNRYFILLVEFLFTEIYFSVLLRELIVTYYYYYYANGQIFSQNSRCSYFYVVIFLCCFEFCVIHYFGNILQS